MAYSRWLESYWYTYWCVFMGEGSEDRDNARFEICAIRSFTAKELRDDLEACITLVLEACKNNTFQPMETEIEDLRDFMKEFLEDVEEKYPFVEA